MKTEDLRIGNLIEYSEDGRIAIVKEIDNEGVKVLFEDGEYVCIEIDEFSPIKITYEWLEKLSFSDQGRSYFYEGWDFFIWKITESENKFELWMLDYEGDEYDESTKIFIMDIDYVHELQNLFFSLNKKELKIK